MAILLKLAGYLSFITATALAFPEFRNTKLLLQEADEYCRIVALTNLLNLNKLTASGEFSSGASISGLLSDALGVNDRKSLRGAFSDMFDSAKGNVIRANTPKDSRQSLNSKPDQDILKEFSRLRVECMRSVMSESSEENENKADDSLATILDTPSARTETKRADLGQTYTGWRERRSYRKDEARIRALMANMREVMEKRKRLEFNPTGW